MVSEFSLEFELVICWGLVFAMGQATSFHPQQPCPGGYPPGDDTLHQ
jgi:hypothetical protein